MTVAPIPASATSTPRRIWRIAYAGIGRDPRQRWQRMKVTAATTGTTSAAKETTAS
jgi:hypothetical protein